MQYDVFSKQKKVRFLFSDIDMTIKATQMIDYQCVYKIKGRSRLGFAR